MPQVTTPAGPVFKGPEFDATTGLELVENLLKGESAMKCAMKSRLKEEHGAAAKPFHIPLPILCPPARAINQSNLSHCVLYSRL